MANNSSTSDSTMMSKPFEQPWSTDKIVRIAILIGIMCLTLAGNLYILFELSFRRRRHPTRLHCFILNLAFSDLAVFGFTMTSELFLLIYDQEWILGNIACKLTLYVQVVTIASTTFINVAMTYDRWETFTTTILLLDEFQWDWRHDGRQSSTK